MNILTKFGGLVAVAALLMAAGSLLVSPVPVHAAANTSCTNGANVFLSSADGTAVAGAAVTSVASGSTTSLYALFDEMIPFGQVAELVVSQGTANGAATGAALTVDTTVVGAGGCTNAGLATGDTAVANNDGYAKFVYVAPTVATDTIVTVALKLGGTQQQFGSITISATVTPDSLTLGAATNTAIPATSVGADPGDAADITLTLSEGGTGLDGQTVTVITTSGLLESDGAGACAADGDDNIANGVQACTATTAGGGLSTISLFGAGASGTATVTFVKGSLSASTDITMFGTATTATGAFAAATIQQSSTNVLTITVVDATGNPIPNTVIADPVVSGQAILLTADGTTPTVATNDCNVGAEGTNGSGECVIQIASSSTATLGDHTLTVTIPGITAKTVVTLKVVGVAATITNDAPASVAANSQTEVSATGVDANGDAVGSVVTTATIIEGNGGLLFVDATTAAGVQKFTFVAPSTSGTTTILVTMGTTASQLITVSVGAAVPTPGAGFGGTLSTGVNLTTYGGGTVAQLGTDSADSGATTVAVTIDGAFVIYVVGAPAFVNQAFSDQYPDGVPAGTVVLVLVS